MSQVWKQRKRNTCCNRWRYHWYGGHYNRHYGCLHHGNVSCGKQNDFMSDGGPTNRKKQYLAVRTKTSTLRTPRSDFGIQFASAHQEELHFTWIVPHRHTCLRTRHCSSWALAGRLYSRCVLLHIWLCLVWGVFPLRITCYSIRVVIALVCSVEMKQRKGERKNETPANRDSRCLQAINRENWFWVRGNPRQWRDFPTPLSFDFKLSPFWIQLAYNCDINTARIASVTKKQCSN